LIWRGIAALRRLTRGDRQMQVGLVIVVGMAAIGLVAPLIAPYSPTTATGEVLVPPGLRHWFGTDNSGLDIFTRTLYAPRVDITIAVAATLVAIVMGVPFGILAGFRGGRWAELLSRLFDIVQAFPFFILAIVLLGIFGPSITNLILVVALVNAPIYFRLLRGEAQRLSERKFVEAARVAGCNDLDVMIRHILPNSLVPLLAQMSVTVAWAIILTAGVSFVGAGVRAPTPEWGVMIADGAPQMTSGQWWTAFFPGLTLALSVMGYALLANAVTDLSDPRKRLVRADMAQSATAERQLLVGP
jgi:peptide/nickel transport system permease protein